MISRVWRGWTTPENAARYEELLRTDILPGIAAKGIPGYRGAHLFRQEHTDEVEFVTVLWFESLAGVRDFMGADYQTAYVPQAAQEILKRFDTHSQHYDVRLTPETTSGLHEKAG